MKNRKFIYLKKQLHFRIVFVTARKRNLMKLSSQLFKTPEVLSMALLAD
jgi:hypothetical protein